PAAAEGSRSLRTRHGMEEDTPAAAERCRTTASRLSPVRCRLRPGQDPWRSTAQRSTTRSAAARVCDCPRGQGPLEPHSRDGDSSTYDWKLCLHTELCVAE